MIKIIVSVLLFMIFLYSYLFMQQKNIENRYKDFTIIDYQLEGKKLKLLVADTPQKHQKGLMNYRTLEGVDGMIFIFSDKQIRSFWNKNTLMDLDLYWINDDKVVNKSFLPSIEKSKEIVTVHSDVVVNKVIEVPAHK